MNTYVPNTAVDQQAMLRSLGAESIEYVLQSVPKQLVKWLARLRTKIS